MKPVISVVISVYNQASSIKLAIDSILAQEYSNFELIIINDGSTDNTKDVLESYQDARIKLIHNDSNLYLAKSLNKGIALAQGDYIARMDADDYAYPQRLSAQLDFLKLHPEVDVLGAAIDHSFNGQIVATKINLLTDEALKANIFFNNPFFHPTVMIKRQFLIDHHLSYDQSLRWIQDYKLWLDMMAAGAIFANLPQACLRYHTSSANKRILQNPTYQLCAQAIWDQQLAWLGLPLTDTNRLRYRQAAWCRFHTHELPAIKLWLDSLIAANQLRQVYPEPGFTQAIQARYAHLRQISGFGYRFKQLCKKFL